MATIPEALAAAIEHHRGGRLSAAELIYRRILQADQNQADAIHLLGLLAHQVGKHELAVEHIERAIGLNGACAAFHNNLGEAYRALRRIPEAVACYRKALELKTDYAEAHSNLGNALQDKEEWSAAEASYRRALELQPDYAEAHNNLGNVLRIQGKPDEAIFCYHRALDLKPDFPEAHSNLGNALKSEGRLDEAVNYYRRTLELKPEFAKVHSNLCYALVFCTDYDAQAILAEHTRWNERHAVPLARSHEAHPNDRSANRRLRIGYVSPDFRDHVVGHNMWPLLREHDHARFEVYGYSQSHTSDHLTEHFRGAADAWRGVFGLSDQALAQQVRQDQIDILVDLTLHMRHNRLLMFARKPAPVQVTFAGYPGTTGLSAIDYRLTDPYLDPPGVNDDHYTEQSIRLADAFWCYDPVADGPAVNLLPAISKGYVTFGCLNNFCKTNPAVFALWSQVLRAVDDSRLILLAAEGTHRQRTLDLLAREGIAASRISFVAHRPRAEYLKLYHEIDLGLDTFPYNGHTTSLDSLWMGVPVVTLVGQTVVGRAGFSQLSNLGLPEFIAHTPEQFTGIAFDWASDFDRLGALRSTLRARMQESPLMDARRFARNVEAAYQEMWRRYCVDRVDNR